MLFKKPILIIAVLILLIGISFYFYQNYQKQKIYDQAVLSAKNPPDHTLVFVGDSMTAYLGNFDELRYNLKQSYPNKNFLLLNYGFGSTNILSVEDRISKESSHSGRIFEPINDIDFDYVFIESFGHNPLSEFSLEEGLKKQTEALERIVSLISTRHPRESIIFIATIAPNKDHYAEGVTVLQPEQREQWVEEREAYIKNHIEFARSHGIPIVNIYEKSLKEETGNIDYINTTDFIHPSPTGIRFISEEIAKFIVQNNFFN